MRSYIRPSCQNLGCNNPAASIKKYSDGSTNWRKYCSKCHNTRTAERHGLKNILEITAMRAGKTVAEYSKEKLQKIAEKNGFANITDYLNSIHRYRKYRETYCENEDGRLGYECTTTIAWDGMLDVDHINGDPTDNRPENLQTLCKCCHAYKTWKFGDAKTPGRKALKVTY